MKAAHHSRVLKILMSYIIIANLKLKNKSDLITSIDKDLLKWIDEQIKNGKCSSRSQLIENAIAQYKKEQE